MKTAFSIQWLKSIQPRKQRKYGMNAPLHIRGNFLHARLSKELTTKHGIRSLRIRSGDKVTMMRGQFKGKSGLVERIDLGRSRIYVAGVETIKKEGGKVPYPIHPSNVSIITIVTDDKKRLKNKTKIKENKDQNGQTTP